MAGVLCIGIAVLDHVFQVDAMPTRAEKFRSQAMATVGGGIAANASVAVARQGGSAFLITRLGDDRTARAILDDLTSEGVDVGLSRLFPGAASQISCILVDRAGERLVVSYADPGMPEGTEWLPAALPAGVDAVLGDTRWEAGSKHMMRIARAAGKPAVMDIDRKPADPELMDAASHAALSAQAAAEMTGLSNPADAAAALASRHPGIWLAVTDGPAGVFWTDSGRIRHTPAFVVEAKDTLGAGDVWHGAFTLGLAEGMSEAAAVRYASAVAALKCMTFGGRKGTPDRAAVEAFLREREGS